MAPCIGWPLRRVTNSAGARRRREPPSQRPHSERSLLPAKESEPACCEQQETDDHRDKPDTDAVAQVQDAGSDDLDHENRHQQARHGLEYFAFVRGHSISPHGVRRQSILSMQGPSAPPKTYSAQEIPMNIEQGRPEASGTLHELPRSIFSCESPDEVRQPRDLAPLQQRLAEAQDDRAQCEEALRAVDGELAGAERIVSEHQRRVDAAAAVTAQADIEAAADAAREEFAVRAQLAAAVRKRDAVATRQGAAQARLQAAARCVAEIDRALQVARAEEICGEFEKAIERALEIGRELTRFDPHGINTPINLRREPSSRMALCLEQMLWLTNSIEMRTRMHTPVNQLSRSFEPIAPDPPAAASSEAA